MPPTTRVSTKPVPVVPPKYAPEMQKKIKEFYEFIGGQPFLKDVQDTLADFVSRYCKEAAQSKDSIGCGSSSQLVCIGDTDWDQGLVIKIVNQSGHDEAYLLNFKRDENGQIKVTGYSGVSTRFGFKLNDNHSLIIEEGN